MAEGPERIGAPQMYDLTMGKIHPVFFRHAQTNIIKRKRDRKAIPYPPLQQGGSNYGALEGNKEKIQPYRLCEDGQSCV